MIVVSDMKRSVAFYRDVLGFPLKFRSNGWTEFKTGTTTIALHGGGAKTTFRPDRMDVGACTIGFHVKNIQKTYEELKKKGVKFVMPPTEREGEGIKLTVCLDPDGLPINIAEHV